MSLNFLIFFFYYLIILISIVGYGSFLLNFEKNKKEFFNFGYSGLIGIFFLTIYSYTSNILLAHTKTHNIILILVGFCLFFYFNRFYFHKFNFKKELIYLVLIFLVLFVSLLVKKNHDDFPYYHFAYTYNLTQESLNFGIGKFNHGFRTPSSIFYLNSLFYLPYAEYYLFNFSSVFILGFSNLILLKKIFYLNTDKKKISFINYFSLLSFVFINIFFYRISEHGTDRSAQILILLLFIFLFELFDKKVEINKNLFFIYVLFGLVISLKSFYFLYTLFFIPFFLFVLDKNKNFLLSLKKIFINKNFLYLFFLIILVLFSYFSNTGCLLYPVSFTCFEKFEWSISVGQVKSMNDWYELWSKAGATPNYRVENPDEYISGLNWVNNWINNYFFNKVSDFLAGLMFVLITFYLIFFKFKKEKKFNINKYILISYLLILLIFIEWFYNHPALRYGGYCIIVLLFFIPFSIYLSKSLISFKKFSKISFVLILVTLFIFESRNVMRIAKEVKLYDYKPLSRTFYSIEDNYFELHKKMKKLKNNRGIFSKTIF